MLLGLAWILGCAGAPPEAAAPAPPTVEVDPTPAGGRAAIALSTHDSSTYRVVAALEGESEFQRFSEDPAGPWQMQRASFDTELVYHAVPAHRSPEGEIGAALVLDALRHRTIRKDPGTPPVDSELELADDRLRIIQGEEVGTDLRGAQPREGLTPRMLLGRSFALLRQDREGRVISIAPQGLPPAKRFLRPLDLRPVIEASRLPRPTEPAPAGTSWSGAFFPLSPAGRLGLRLDATWEIAGFESVDGHPCAWIVLRGGRKGDEVVSETGIRFDRVVASVEGQAWLDLATARVRRYVVEEDVRALYTRTTGRDRGTRHRARHRGRVELELLDPAPEEGAPWADGTERFRRI